MEITNKVTNVQNKLGQPQQRIAFATCKAFPHISTHPTARDDLLADELVAHGYQIEACPWNDPSIKWNEYDLVLMRSVWDYHLHRKEFSAWLNDLEKDDINVLNPVEIIKWNMDKIYMLYLKEKGIEIVDTIFIENTTISLKDIFKQSGWISAILKPSVGLNGYRTYKISNIIEACKMQQEFESIIEHAGCAMVQKFLPSITTIGEWSVFYFGGCFSHVMLQPPANTFIRMEHAAENMKGIKQPPSDLLNAAQKVMDALEWPTAYARIDMLEDKGAYKILELEVLDAGLYFGHKNETCKIVANVIMNHLKNIIQ